MNSFKTEDNVPAGKLQEMNENFFASLKVKVTEEGVGSELDPDPVTDLLVRDTDPLVRRYGSADLNAHRNVTEPHTAFQRITYGKEMPHRSPQRSW